jgi:hypothetical protein
MSDETVDCAVCACVGCSEGNCCDHTVSTETPKPSA